MYHLSNTSILIRILNILALQFHWYDEVGLHNITGAIKIQQFWSWLTSWQFEISFSWNIQPVKSVNAMNQILYHFYPLQRADCWIFIKKPLLVLKLRCLLELSVEEVNLLALTPEIPIQLIQVGVIRASKILHFPQIILIGTNIWISLHHVQLTIDVNVVYWFGSQGHEVIFLKMRLNDTTQRKHVKRE